MNIKISMIILLLIAISGFAAFYPETDPKPKEAIILNAIIQVQDKAHYKKVNIDDDFSEQVFDLYLESMDYGKRFLTQNDVDALSPFKKEIDNQSLEGQLNFFELSLETINSAIAKSEGYFNELIDQPVDFSVKESYETSGEKRTFSSTDAELKDFWRRMLKYETIIRLDRAIEKQEKDKDEEDFEKKSREEMEADAIEKVKEMYERWFERTDDVRRSDRFEMFVNSITHVFDPHTDYYNPKEKEDFDINMSGRLEGIGARLQTDGDYTKVVSIIPGGPAWKQKQLEVDDLIYSVRQGEDEESNDVTGMRIDDVVKQIRGKKGTIVTLTVKKKDGSTDDISIERDEVIIDEGFAKSLILKHDSLSQDLGYIYLPRFYTNFNSKNGPKAGTDMAKEIEKLKSENIGGIILDLRNNGGGSLNEVVDISGLFIKTGPVVQVKNRTGQPYVYRDKDSKVQYDGPLVVLVNAYSASASEILVAALQDYNRAVIVGSNSTFGKGTVQRFFDLDRAVMGASDVKPLGQIKITTQKYYRINGGSVQLRGVIPDIVLPDRFSYIQTGEKEYDHAMDWTQINPIDYSQDIFNITNEDFVVAQSKARVEANPIFQKIDDNAKRIKRLREESTAPLNFDEYSALVDAKEEEAKQYKNLTSKIEALTLINPTMDNDYINLDSSRIARNDDWKEKLHKDIYLEEAVMIMKDLTVVDRP